jgi:hypothetical protein
MSVALVIDRISGISNQEPMKQGVEVTVGLSLSIFNHLYKMVFLSEN